MILSRSQAELVDELLVEGALLEGRDFDPNQPRDENGRWRRIGTGIGITPNIEMVGSFGEAHAKWSDPEFQATVARFEEDMTKELGQEPIFHRQIGMWNGQWEPSFEVLVDGMSGSDAHAAAEKLQKDYGQEGVVSFSYGHGEDASVTIGGFDDPDEMGKVLVENGMPGSSFAMHGRAATVLLQNDQAGQDALRVLL